MCLGLLVIGALRHWGIGSLRHYVIASLRHCVIASLRHCVIGRQKYGDFQMFVYIRQKAVRDSFGCLTKWTVFSSSWVFSPTNPVNPD